MRHSAAPPRGPLPDRRVAVRHSKRPGEAILLYARADWRAFVAGAKAYLA